MKKKNKKILTLMLAGACCAAAVAGTARAAIISSSAATNNSAVELTSVFTTSEAKMNGDNSKTNFVFNEKGYATFNRDLALKWFETKGTPSYLTLKFSFADLNFDSIAWKFESKALVANADDKAVNKIVFGQKDNKVTVKVNDGEAKPMAIEANTEVVITLNEVGCEKGEFNVLVNNEVIGKFVDIGANYAARVTDTSSNTKKDSLQIEADVAADKTTTTVVLHEINGQSFETKLIDGKSKLEDNAAPVLVVNEQFTGLQLGSTFSLDTKTIDVLYNSPSTSKQYYQWNGIKDDPVKADYKDLSSNTHFMDTNYEKDGVKGNVFVENGVEYASIKYKVSDAVFKNDTATSTDTRKEYDLSWYIEDEFKSSALVTKGTTDYIVLSRNEKSAWYKILTLDDVNKTNVKSADYDEQVANYQAAVEKAADKVNAGSNSSFYLPSLLWMLDDDNGFSNLKFTVSYKSPSSTSPTSTSNLYISASKEGWYEFKVFATDKADNKMKYYNEEGELIELTSTNVWDIEEIPSFTYEVKNTGFSVDEPSSTSALRTTKVLNESYTFSDAKVVGATSQQKEYKLFKLKSFPAGITNSDLTSVKYEDIIKGVNWENTDRFDAYMTAYARKLAEKLGNPSITVDTIKDLFVEVEAYNDRISEEDTTAWNNSDNRYNWNATAGSFSTAEEGVYMIFADYWEKELPQQRAAAYKVIIVESEADIIKGETEWLQNNIVSVVLFSIAAVMLILIIILLLIKPSDETLEDVDAKAAKRKAAQAKKSKKD